MVAEEQKQWDLTEKEVRQLQYFEDTRIAQMRILENLTKIGAGAVAEERDWWKAVRLNYNIPESLKFNLIADPLIGKVWVKGEVPSLDSSKKYGE